MAIVRFNYADVNPIKLKRKGELKEFIQSIFSKEGKEVNRLDYIFCSDVFLLDINRSFLKHDYFTDIVTFDLSEGNGTVGEIYISTERVKDNSKIHGSNHDEEMMRVIFHGALHLIGYSDKKKSEKAIMREKEDYYLHLFTSKLV
jgi:rRNA maturation RNase YbeY